MDIYEIIYQRHAVERMAQRGVSEEDVVHVIHTGEAILGLCRRYAISKRVDPWLV